MISEIVSALMLGLAGSTHCLGMCGGVNSLMMTPASTSAISSVKPSYVLLFNMGRVLSYGVAGMALGSVSFAIQSLSPNVALLTRFLAGFILFGMACYVGRWWQGVAVLERYAAYVWRYIQPLSQYLVPVNTSFKAFKLGAVWGWMPCGMVYSALSWAVLSSDPIKAGLLMLVFGIGTLPAMLGAGVFAQSVARVSRNPIARHVAALMLLAFAVWTIISALIVDSSSTLHHHHHLISQTAVGLVNMCA